MNHLTLRTLQPADAASLLQFELTNRAWFERTIEPRDADFYTLDGVQAQIAMYLRGHAEQTWHPFLILDRHGAIVGRANLKHIDQHHGCAELGYRLGQSQISQGYATQAVRHVISVAENRWHLTRLVAYASVANPASARVLEKAGFLLGETIAHLATIQEIPLAGHRYTRELKPGVAVTINKNKIFI